MNVDLVDKSEASQAVGNELNPCASNRNQTRDCTFKYALEIRSPLSWPPSGRRVARGNLGRPQSHELAALVGVAAELRTIFAAHIALEFVDRRGLPSPDDIQRDCLVGIATEAVHFEITIPGRVTDRGRRLCRPLIAEHSRIPCLTGEPIRLFTRSPGPIRCGADLAAVDPLSRLGAHGANDAATGAEIASR